MKTLVGISKEHNIPRTTLYDRIRRNGLITIKHGRDIFINQDQEKIIITPIQRQYKGMVNQNVSPALVWEYKLNAPFLSIEELAECLAVKPMEIEMIIKDDFLIMESKINNRPDFRALNNLENFY